VAYPFAFPAPSAAGWFHRALSADPRAANPPAGPGWLHEVKHDAFRTLARKQGERVDVWSR
jgi:ATP-dependent DNA ligase